MAEGISSFSPSIAEEKWVEQGRTALDSEQAIEIDSTPTIFQVPKSLKETKPEAYTPSLLGLGPYHHLRPDLHATHARKLALIKKYQERVPENIYEASIRKMLSLESGFRASYDKYLDMKSLTVAYILFVDSFYLLDFLGSYARRTESSSVLEQPRRRELVKDVLMLENQIPVNALLEVGKLISLFNPEEGTDETMGHSQLFYYFCKAHSPLKLADGHQQSAHLLAHMYYLIVNNRGLDQAILCSASVGTEIFNDLRELGLGGPMIKPILLASKVEIISNSTLFIPSSHSRKTMAGNRSPAPATIP